MLYCNVNWLNTPYPSSANTAIIAATLLFLSFRLFVLKIETLSTLRGFSNSKYSKNHGLFCLYLIQAFDYATDDLEIFKNICSICIIISAWLSGVMQYCQVLAEHSGRSGGKFRPLRKKSPGPLTFWVWTTKTFCVMCLAISLSLQTNNNLFNLFLCEFSTILCMPTKPQLNHVANASFLRYIMFLFSFNDYNHSNN